MSGQATRLDRGRSSPIVQRCDADSWRAMIERSFRHRYVQIRRHFLHVIFKKTFPVRKSLFHNDLYASQDSIALADVRGGADCFDYCIVEAGVLPSFGRGLEQGIVVLVGAVRPVVASPVVP